MKIAAIDQDLTAQCEQDYIVRLEAHINAPRRKRTPEEEADWLEDKRAEHDADRMAGDYWSNW